MLFRSTEILPLLWSISTRMNVILQPSAHELNESARKAIAIRVRAPWLRCVLSAALTKISSTMCNKPGTKEQRFASSFAPLFATTSCELQAKQAGFRG